METSIAQTSNTWKTADFSISHNLLKIEKPTSFEAQNDSKQIRMHFGLEGSYQFTCGKLDQAFTLSGHHNNLMYTDGQDLHVHTQSNRIETFGIEISPEAFFRIAGTSGGPLRKIIDCVESSTSGIIASNWKSNSLRIQHCISEIIHNTYTGPLQDIYLGAKCLELIVLQAALYTEKEQHKLRPAQRLDREKIIAAREILLSRYQEPPSISELARQVGINEYKLKKGFRDFFATSIFSYVLRCRMRRAVHLLIDSQKSIKEIGYEVGYKTPQHFSGAFRKQFGKSPKMVRENPDLVTRTEWWELPWAE